MLKVLCIIAQQNFRDEEYSIPKEMLEKAGAKVTTASITKEEAVGMFGLRITPDRAVAECNPNDFDALIVVGGSGSPKLAGYPEVLDLIRRFRQQNKPIAAICLGGYVLSRAGILKGVKATVYPADFAIAEYRKAGVNYTAEHVVADNNIITADGPDAAKEFAKQIAKKLFQG